MDFSKELDKQSQYSSLDSPKESIFCQYEKVIITSLATSFGLDFLLIKDQYGGDVDTVLNVRKIGQHDENGNVLTYKNQKNEEFYNKHHGQYDNKEFHGNEANYRSIRNSYSKQMEDGSLKDGYTGENLYRNKGTALDHVVSSKEIYDDKARYLGQGEDFNNLDDAIDFANRESNLVMTDSDINNAKSDSSVSDFLNKKNAQDPEYNRTIEKKIENTENNLERCESQLDELSKNHPEDLGRIAQTREKVRHYKERVKKLKNLKNSPEKMKRADELARKAYDSALESRYYTSSDFLIDTASAAGNTAFKMGIRQAVGMVFYEIWRSIREEFNDMTSQLEFKEILYRVKTGIEKGFSAAKTKYKEIIEKFKEGFFSGLLSSLTTTIINIFATTAKNTVRLLRQIWSSLTEALNILLFNPNDLPFGDRLLAASKVIATGASILVGITVESFIRTTGIGSIPIVGEIISVFCGAFVTGIMSCSILYFLDNNEFVKKVIKWLNDLPTMGNVVRSYKEQSKEFQRIAEQCYAIDVEYISNETEFFENFATNVKKLKNNPSELKESLEDSLNKKNINIPWEKDGFENFIKDKSKKLVIR